MSGSAHVRAADTARVTARDRAVVEAGGEATVRASGSATVLARDRVIVEAERRGVGAAPGTRASCARAGPHSSCSPPARPARAAASAHIAARGQSILDGGDSSRVRAYEQARVARARGGHRAGLGLGERRRLRARRCQRLGLGDACAALGESTVEARESCFVEAGGSAHVRAFGASIVRARGRATIDALDHVSVTIHGSGDRPSTAAA